MKKPFPLCLHSDFSRKIGISSTKEINKKIATLGYEGWSITDIGSLAGSISAKKTAADKKAGFNNRIILGCDYLNADLEKTTILAKNDIGWKGLIESFSYSNNAKNFNKLEELGTITTAELGEYGKGHFIAITGQVGSELFNAIFSDRVAPYLAVTETEAYSYVASDYRQRLEAVISRYNEIYGAENVYIGPPSLHGFAASQVATKVLREFAESNNLKTTATFNNYYLNKEQGAAQRIILCAKLRTNLAVLKDAIARREHTLSPFILSSSFHIPTLEEMNAAFSEAEIETSNEIAAKCENYDVLGKPSIPKFKPPEEHKDKNSIEYLTHLCRVGWKTKIAGRFSKEEEQIYVDRVKKELAVISKAALEDYFLITGDFCQWIANQGWLKGLSRGSAGGSLVSFLCNITGTDPIEDGLIFERFYNEGRNTAERVEYPDIDIDVPQSKRDKVIEYLKGKHGVNCVAHMSNYQTLQGKKALKEVLSAHSACSFTEQNTITELIPGKEEISDELELMRKAGEKPSGLMWALRNVDGLSEYCKLNARDELEGEFALYFKQGIEIEGTRVTRGKHASGIIITDRNLLKSCPMVYDKRTHEYVIEYDMHDANDTGFLKYDILGLSTLDVMMDCLNELRTGKDEDE